MSHSNKRLLYCTNVSSDLRSFHISRYLKVKINKSPSGVPLHLVFLDTKSLSKVAQFFSKNKLNASWLRLEFEDRDGLRQAQTHKMASIAFIFSFIFR